MPKPNLRVDRRLYEVRKNRLKRFIELDAPDCIIEMAARAVIQCFPRRTIGQLWHELQVRHFPGWLFWLTSKDYREACRLPDDDGEFETEMLRMFGGSTVNPAESAIPFPAVSESLKSVAPTPPESEGTPG